MKVYGSGQCRYTRQFAGVHITITPFEWGVWPLVFGGPPENPNRTTLHIGPLMIRLEFNTTYLPVE